MEFPLLSDVLKVPLHMAVAGLRPWQSRTRHALHNNPAEDKQPKHRSLMTSRGGVQKPLKCAEEVEEMESEGHGRDYDVEVVLLLAVPRLRQLCVCVFVVDTSIFEDHK